MKGFPAMTHQGFSEAVKDLHGGSGDLVPALQRVQAVEGYLSRESVGRIARWLRTSENEIYGVATFFAQFRFTRPGEHVVKVCLGTACHVKGGVQILDVLKRRLSIEPGEATADGKYQLERVACLGCCALAPVVTVDNKIYGETSVLKVHQMFEERENRDDA
jgi:NADH:ubiquinone oxidoreductase subunit E